VEVPHEFAMASKIALLKNKVNNLINLFIIICFKNLTNRFEKKAQFHARVFRAGILQQPNICQNQ